MRSLRAPNARSVAFHGFVFWNELVELRFPTFAADMTFRVSIQAPRYADT
jgi:hypothetical protein